jgi:hypothetical protein
MSAKRPPISIATSAVMSAIVKRSPATNWCPFGLLMLCTGPGNETFRLHCRTHRGTLTNALAAMR